MALKAASGSARTNKVGQYESKARGSGDEGLRKIFVGVWG